MDVNHINAQDITALIHDKYDGNKDADIAEDLKRLAAGEPLAYVIGWIPFLGLKIYLGKNAETEIHPLIPRPETEWWTEKLIEHLRYKFEDRPFKFLDLCAGSGAIGLAILSTFPNAKVSFGELEPGLQEIIRINMHKNDLDENRADIQIGNLFEPFAADGENYQFDIIATNPPYIPEARKAELSSCVTKYEIHNALFSGEIGIDVITQIIKESPNFLSEDGELWMECDISNIEAAKKLVSKTRESTIELDQYGRERLLVIQNKNLDL